MRGNIEVELKPVDCAVLGERWNLAGRGLAP